MYEKTFLYVPFSSFLRTSVALAADIAPNLKNMASNASLGVGFECFSNKEEDVFLGFFGAGSDSEDDGEKDARKGEPMPPVEDGEEPFDPNSYTEAVYRIPESVSCDCVDSNIEIVLIERKHLGIAHQLWPAAGFLCEFFLKHKSWLQTECRHSSSEDQSTLNVLELGAGIGLCGMYVGALMQHSSRTKVLLTDLPGAINGLNENINRNSLEASVHAKVLSWGDIDEFDVVMEEFHGQAPLVIAADCVYWECLYEPLFQTIKALVGRGCKVIISHVRRWKKDGKFFAMCKKAGMRVSVWVEEVKTVPAEHTNVPTRQVTRIYCIESGSSQSVNPAGSVSYGGEKVVEEET